MQRTSRASRPLPEIGQDRVRASSFYIFAELYPFLGREQEVEAVCTLLRSPDTRLLSLTGTGGVGKTRLALQTTKALLEEFPDGLCFVPLASVRNPALVLPTIAQAFGLGEFGARQPLERIKAHVQTKRLLLLLDNFEQVLTVAPSLLELLLACPQLKMLVTSREVLRLRCERAIPVLPLTLPDLKRLPATAPLSQTLFHYTAIQLFLQHAQLANPAFQMTDENARAIAEICIHLDGLPLAIELAASHMKLLSPQKLLARLERRLPLLIGGMRDVSERQRTLRNTIKWSYDLLNPPEQSLFRRFSVFAGGCTLEAMESICASIDGESANVLQSLLSLFDKHLLQQVTQTNGEPRLLMLETIREFALECLEMSDEADVTRQAHAAYCLALAEAAEPELRSANQVMWLARLEQEHDNMRAALNWFTRWEDGEKALRLCAALWRFWMLRGHLSEGRQWLERTLASNRGTMTPLRAKVLEGAGRIAIYQSDFARAAAVFSELATLSSEPRIAALALNALGYVQRLKGNYPAAQTMFEQGLALYREVRDRWGIAETLWLLSDKAYFAGDCASALALGKESLSIYRELGDKASMPTVLLSLATILLFQGKDEEARASAEESLCLSRELGDQHGISYAYGLSILGRVAFHHGEYAQAQTNLQASLALFRELGAQQGVAHVLGFFGHLTLRCGDPVAARSLLEESLTLSRQLEDRWLVTLALDGLGQVAAAQKQPVWAARLWAASQSIREKITSHTQPIEHVDYKASLTSVRAVLGERAFAAAWAEGRALTLEEVAAALMSSIPRTTAEAQETVAPRLASTKQRASVPGHIEELTPREQEVMRLVTMGMTDAQIAERLIVSTRTVNAHLRSIYSKLGVRSRSAAIHFVTAHHLLQDQP